MKKNVKNQKVYENLYSGSTNYTKSTNKINTKNNNRSTKTVKLGKQMSIYGKLTDNKGQNIANQKITIKVNGKTYTTNTTII